MDMPSRTLTTGNGYRYSINGQEKSLEIAPNTTTAEFWQYDARIGRRWNIDPVVKEYESPYAAFANNPIWFSDQNGADTSKYLTNSQLLDAVKMARKQAQKVVQDKGDYNDKSYQENLLQQAKDYGVKNNLTLYAALEFQKQSNTYFRLYYWQWSWSQSSKELLGQDANDGEITDAWKIKLQVYTIQLYEQKHRALKGTSLSFVGILTQYAIPKLTDLSIAGQGPQRIITLPEVVLTSKSRPKLNPFELEMIHGLTLSKAEFATLKANIKIHGIKESVKYVENNGVKYIVDGHHRVRIAKELGIKNIPVEKVQLPYGSYKTTNDLIYTRY
jgi:hypothetical protein